MILFPFVSFLFPSFTCLAVFFKSLILFLFLGFLKIIFESYALAARYY